MLSPASAGSFRRCRSSAGWRGPTPIRSLYRSRASLNEMYAPDRIARMARSERCRPSQAIRGSACRLVRPSASTTPGIADTALAKAGLLSHRSMLRAPRCAIAERIGEMPDIAAKRRLRDRSAHRHFARARPRPSMSTRPDSSRSRFRSSPVGSAASFRQFGPVHRCLARQRREINGVSLAEIIDRGGKFGGGSERIQPSRKL